jgi:hypothetical protein
VEIQYISEMKAPNDETRAAMIEADEMVRKRRARFNNATSVQT